MLPIYIYIYTFFFLPDIFVLLPPPPCHFAEFSLFSFNNGMVVSSCRELDNNRSALSAASAFAIATAGANEGTPTKEKYRRMSLASTGQSSGNMICLANQIAPGERHLQQFLGPWVFLMQYLKWPLGEATITFSLRTAGSKRWGSIVSCF